MGFVGVAGIQLAISVQQRLLAFPFSLEGGEMVEKRPAAIGVIKPNEAMAAGGGAGVENVSHRSQAIVGMVENAQGDGDIRWRLRPVGKEVSDFETNVGT